MNTLKGESLVWGWPNKQVKPIIAINDLPGEKVIVLPESGPASLRVTTAEGSREFILLDRGETWELGPQKAAA